MRLLPPVSVLSLASVLPPAPVLTPAPVSLASALPLVNVVMYPCRATIQLGGKKSLGSHCSSAEAIPTCNFRPARFAHSTRTRSASTLWAHQARALFLLCCMPRQRNL